MSRTKGEPLRIGRETVAITRPDKVLFPNDGITKRELVDYYRRIAPAMLPYLRGRPIAMQRYPDGIAAQGFFQKRAAAHYPDWIATATLAKQNGSVRYVVCDDAATLVYLANQAVLTPHTWLSLADKPDYPDQMIFDLDPPNGDFGAVRRAAIALREILKEHGLKAFAKTTGARGLHVLVPLDRTRDFDAVRAFAQEIARQMADAHPQHLTTEVRKNKRAGRIFLDTARNAYGQTAAPPYAVRARDGAPVATPLSWDEVSNPRLRPGQFNICNIFDRLERVEDPWRDVRKHARAAPASRLTQRTKQPPVRRRPPRSASRSPVTLPRRVPSW
jgi:bifunctional non-homologous end joining protein LigD